MAPRRPRVGRRHERRLCGPARRARPLVHVFELQTMYVDGAECDFGIAQAGAELFILPSVLSTRPIPTQAKVVRYNLRGPNT